MRFIKETCLVIIIYSLTNSFLIGRVLGQDVQEENPYSSISSGKTFRWGLKAGGTLNQFNQSGLTIGFNGGAIFKGNISRVFDIQAEALYMMQGSGRDDYSQSFSDLGGNVASITYSNRAISLQSAEIPLILIIKLGTAEGKITPKLMIGASYGYCFAAYEHHDKHYYFTDGTEGISGNQVENVLSDFENHQFDAIGGFGIDFDLSNGKLFIFDIRYQYGLNDINIYKSPVTGGPVFQNTLSMNFSYAF